MAEHNDRTEQYGKTKKVPVPKTSGYPNNVANTQTERTRGCKNTTRGYGHSKKMG